MIHVLLPLLLLISPLVAQIPRTWETRAVETLQLPLVNRPAAKMLSQERYYAVPERVIYQSYPVYAPGREPAGYQEWLQSREPVVVGFDALSREGDGAVEKWVAAGEIVFHSPTSMNPMFFGPKEIRDPEFVRSTGMPVAKNGVIPFARWVVRRKSVVELGSMGCATCHVRVLPDGSIVPGAQSNNPADLQGALLLSKALSTPTADTVLDRVRSFALQFELPWRQDDDFNRLPRTMSLAELVQAGRSIPPGVNVRANTSLILPPQIPDLIGVRERRFLDHTGIIRHREIGDLMRYSTIAQDFFGEQTPAARYSDSQLYALAQYLYSLRPPVNPNPVGAAAANRGRRVFNKSGGCARCHTPPLYTNNGLVPAEGGIGVDPRYALGTRKGTGYYKVPSLKGLWYRGPLGHQGAAATLEEWLDTARLGADYTPKGFAGIDGKQRSIPGHEFGLNLQASEKRDLIAFLRTL
jgi:hypothetical protein